MPSPTPPSPRPPSVSVVIPAAAAPAVVGRATASALGQDYPAIVEVIVAAADVETAAAASAVGDPRVRVVENPSGHTPAALNLAVAEASGEIVVRCDTHAQLPQGYVTRAVATMQETGAVNVGGRQVPVGRTPFERAVAVAMTSPLGAGGALYRVGGKAGPTDTVYLGVFRRAALESVGGFDESMRRNQDYELNWRLREAGGVVWFDPELGVEYTPRSSVPSLWRQYFGYGRGKRHMLSRHPRSLRLRQLAAPVLVTGTIAAVVLGLAGVRWALVLPAAYVAATLGAGVVDAVRFRRAAALLEPLALWTMHFAWGTGFLLGPSAGD